MIEADGVSKRYGNVIALASATFDARDGEITALIGSNGSGKTTMLRAVAGPIDPDAGRVTIDDIAVQGRRREALGKLGFMPDGGGLYPTLTAREHVELFARLHGLMVRR